METRKILLMVVALLLVAMVPTAIGETIYVKAGASGNGSSWANAYNDLQDGLDDAVSGDDIWVAEGTYKPSEEVGGSGDLYKTFQMKNGVEIYGGFPNTGDPDMDDRDPATYETILNGEIGITWCRYLVTGSSGTASSAVLDGFTLEKYNFYGMYNDNADPTVNDCIFDGLDEPVFGINNENGSAPTVTNCVFEYNARGMYNDSGSPTVTNCTFSDNSMGMYNVSSSAPTITNCTFTNNNSASIGGGMYSDNSTPTLTDCTFTGNKATGSSPDGKGGGMYNYNSDLTMNGCTFEGNEAENYGGGMYNKASVVKIKRSIFTDNKSGISGAGIYNIPNYNPDPDVPSDVTIVNCIFKGNEATDSLLSGCGGGICNFEGNLTVTNCLFEGNIVEGEPPGTGSIRGGGIYSDDSDTEVTNSTFCGNMAKETWGGNGGLAHGGGVYLVSGAEVKNCIFWDNRFVFAGSVGGSGHQIGGSPTVTYSCIQDWTAGGAGNIATDPCFVDSGEWSGDTWDDDENGDGTDYHLEYGLSKCIDVGSNSDIPDDVLDLDENSNTEEDTPFDLDMYPRRNDDPDVTDGSGTAPIVDMGAYEVGVAASCFTAYWPLDDGSGQTAYDEIGSNDGTLTNGPVWSTGPVDGALDFDGTNDYVSLSSNAITTTEFSVSGWAKHEGAGGGNLSANFIFSQRDDTIGDDHSLIGLYTDNTSGKAGAGIRSSDGSHQKLEITRKDYNEWHHYTLTVSESELVLYVDGTEVASASNNQQGDYTTSIDHVYIGKNEYTGVLQTKKCSYFDGLIDEVKIFCGALSANEVKDLYESDFFGPYWKFDEGQGSVAYDSVSDNDGTLTNDPCWTTGKVDGALDFDGSNDYVSLSSNAVTTTEFTVSGWANHQGAGGGNLSANFIFLQRDDTVGDDHSLISLYTDNTSGQAGVGIRSSDGSRQKLGTTRKDYNGWHHYAVTVSTSELVFYIDGTEVNSVTNNQQGDYITSIDHVYIGKNEYTGYQGTKTSYFNGLIDEVRVWNRPLSSDEIEDIYEAGL